MTPKHNYPHNCLGRIKSERYIIVYVMLFMCVLGYHTRNLVSLLHERSSVHAQRFEHLPLSESDIVDGWNRVLHDWLLPFSSGITSRDIDETFSQALGDLVVIQHIKGSFYVVDPTAQCSSPQAGQTFKIDRCFAIYSILKDTASEMRGSLPDFEFVYDFSDLPAWNTSRDEKPMPGFGSVRCWEKGFMSFPMFGSHGRWDIRDVDDNIAQILNQNPRPFFERKNSAVFRGGLRGCSFPPEHNDMQQWQWHEFNKFYKGAPCGRHKLQIIGRDHPDLVDFVNTDNSSAKLSMERQEDMFKYIISAEGHGGWADRLFELMFYDVGVIVQEHPCKEWFEDMFFPFQHYIPVSNDFSNVLGRISWAERHPNQIENMIRSKINRAKRILSRRGIITFSTLMWTRYAEIQQYPIIRRNGTVRLDKLFP